MNLMRLNLMARGAGETLLFAESVTAYQQDHVLYSSVSYDTWLWLAAI